MNQANRQAFAKKASGMPALSNKKLPTENRVRSKQEQNGLDANLRSAALNGQLDDVKRFMMAGANVNAGDADGDTALNYAASNGHTHICALLLEKGADANARNKNGDTPLMLAAACSGKIEACRLLLENGAGKSINAADVNNETALTMAAAGYHADLCVLLLDNGARQIRAALKIADMNTWYKIVEWTSSSMRNIAGSEEAARKFRAPFYACTGKA